MNEAKANLKVWCQLIDLKLGGAIFFLQLVNLGWRSKGRRVEERLKNAKLVDA